MWALYRRLKSYSASSVFDFMFCPRNCVASSLVKSAAELAVCCGQVAWLKLPAAVQVAELNTPGESNMPTTPGAGEGGPNTAVSSVAHTPGVRQVSSRH